MLTAGYIDTVKVIVIKEHTQGAGFECSYTRDRGVKNMWKTLLQEVITKEQVRFVDVNEQNSLWLLAFMQTKGS